MQKDTRPAPIVFVLSNIEPTSRFIGMAFTWINYLVFKEQSSIHKFIKEIDLFSMNEYALLTTRIMNKRNKEVQMNEKHFIIMYATIYFTSLVMLSQTEMDYILKDLEEGDGEEEEGEMEETKQAYILFAKNTFRELKHNYSNNHHLALAMTKIHTFQIPQ